MRSKMMQRMLRVLITLLGAGIGAAVALLCLKIFSLAAPGRAIPLGILVAAYSGLTLAGALLFFLLRYRILEGFTAAFSAVERRFMKMPMEQLVSCVTGLLAGLVISVLLSQILNYVGEGIAPTIISAILMITLGSLGWTVGWKRGRDFSRYLGRLTDGRMTRHEAKKERKRRLAAIGQGNTKVVDTSILIDGRIVDVCRLGFLEGRLVIPDFVLQELRQVADASDSQRRARGKRGLETLEKLRTNARIVVQTDATDWTDTEDADVKLLRLARKLNAALLTGDGNLAKIAAASEVPVLSVNALAQALKPAVLAGETLTVTISKEGKESTQGVGYLDDGTMIVVEGGREHLGEALTVTVTGALQTSNGKMIFARMA